MKKMDSLGLKMCNYQAKLFEKSLGKMDCSSRIFIRRFMNSNLAKRMDAYGTMFDSLDITEAIDEIEEQYGKSSYGIDKYTTDELYWIGYIYRYWAYVREMSSKQIYKKIKPEQLRNLYFPYHSLDPLQAIERIEETLNDKYGDMDDIARGVEILRKIRAKHK
jgi:hypothetical protein